MPLRIGIDPARQNIVVRDSEKEARLTTTTRADLTIVFDMLIFCSNNHTTYSYDKEGTVQTATVVG